MPFFFKFLYAFILFSSLQGSWIGFANAADFTAREISQALFQARTGTPLDLSGKDLSGLNLADLNFTGANLSGVDLLGADLSGAIMTRVNLTSARLDRATLFRTDFTDANLENASILRPSIYSTFLTSDMNWKEAPRFTRSRMAGAHLFGRFDYVDFKGADLKGAIFAGRDPRDEKTSLARVGLFSGDFEDANLEGADFTDGKLAFASFKNAHAEKVRFVGADLTRADFEGATLAGADFTGANVDEANFKGAQGFEQVKGLEKALNGDRLIPPSAVSAP